MSVTGQVGYPDSVLSKFLDARLPQRAMAAQTWARRVETASWAGIETPPDYRKQLGNAIEVRIGLDLGAAPGYWDLLSFLPPEECRVLLTSAGYSLDAKEHFAHPGTTDPLLQEWTRACYPIAHDDDQRAALSACWYLAMMRDTAHLTKSSAQVRRYLLADTREFFGTDSPLDRRLPA